MTSEVISNNTKHSHIITQGFLIYDNLNLSVYLFPL